MKSKHSCCPLVRDWFDKHNVSVLLASFGEIDEDEDFESIPLLEQASRPDSAIAEEARDEQRARAGRLRSESHRLHIAYERFVGLELHREST